MIPVNVKQASQLILMDYVSEQLKMLYATSILTVKTGTATWWLNIATNLQFCIF